MSAIAGPLVARRDHSPSARFTRSGGDPAGTVASLYTRSW